jgi:hypothetical protein
VGPSACQNATSNSRPGARPRTSRVMARRSVIFHYPSTFAFDKPSSGSIAGTQPSDHLDVALRHRPEAQHCREGRNASGIAMWIRSRLSPRNPAEYLIPAAIRRLLKLQEGSEVLMRVDETGIRLGAREQALAHVHQRLRRLHPRGSGPIGRTHPGTPRQGEAGDLCCIAVFCAGGRSLRRGLRGRGGPADTPRETGGHHARNRSACSTRTFWCGP